MKRTLVTLLALTLFAASAQAALLDDLHAYYPFENNSSGAGGVLDISGNARHGTGPVGGGLTTVTGKVGNALNFDGAGGSEVIVNQAPESDFDFVNSDFTVQAWFKVNSFDKDWQALVAKGEGAGWRIARHSSSNNLAVNMGQGDTATGNINDGAWHHLVGIHKAGTITDIYVDGSLATSGGGGGPGDVGGTLTIGDNPEANNRNWNGLIDEVVVWNRALIPDEVTTLYNGGNGTGLLDTVNYDWSPDGDQGLQGWTIVKEDTTSYTAINPYTFADRGDRLGPPHGSVLAGAGEIPAGGDQDAAHKTLVAESPVFTIGSDQGNVTQVDFRLNQGSAGGPLVADYASLPTDSTGTSGFVGLALQRVSDGAYLLSEGKDSNNSAKDYTWDAAALAAATSSDSPTETYTLQFIDYKHGSWGHIGLQNVTLTTIIIPEPATLALAAVGLLGLRRRRHA